MNGIKIRAKALRLSQSPCHRATVQSLALTASEQPCLEAEDLVEHSVMPEELYHAGDVASSEPVAVVAAAAVGATAVAEMQKHCLRYISEFNTHFSLFLFTVLFLFTSLFLKVL